GKDFTMEDGVASYRGHFDIDPKNSPKTIDIHFTEGPEQGNTALGIYEIKGDEFKLCLTVTAKNRPTEFAAPPNSGLGLEVLKRIGGKGKEDYVAVASYPNFSEDTSGKAIKKLLDENTIPWKVPQVNYRAVVVSVPSEKQKAARDLIATAIKDGKLSVLQ